MKTFSLLLGISCLVLFYLLKTKTEEFAVQETTISELNNQLNVEKQGHEADVTKLKAAVEAMRAAAAAKPVEIPAPVVVQPVQPAPVAVQAPVAAATPAQVRTAEGALAEFAATMSKEIETSPPPFVIFMDQSLGTADDQAFAPSDTDWKLAVDRYNGFVTHVFPRKPELRMVASTSGGPPNASSSRVNLSPAKMLWLAAEEGSPDAKYAVRWMKINPPQMGVAQGAMQALEGVFAGSGGPNSATLARSLHDAESALKKMLTGRAPVAEDQRQVAFFLRNAGIAK